MQPRPLLWATLWCFVAATSSAETIVPGSEWIGDANFGRAFAGRVVAQMRNSVFDAVAPGMVVVVGPANSTVSERDPVHWPPFAAAAGRFTYDPTSAKVDLNTMYDIASLTKVTITTTAVALLFQRGILANLDSPVADDNLLGHDFAQQGKDAVTLRMLLLHTAGFPPDPTPYWYGSTEFGCPEFTQYTPQLSFSCVDKIFNALCNQTLQTSPGQVFNYSDLSMITMMFVIGKVVQTRALVPPSDYDPRCSNTSSLVCAFMAFVAKDILGPLNITASSFIPASILNIPPLWDDRILRHRWIQGFVSDENSFALGGVSGHAGFFATGPELARIVDLWANPSDQGPLNSSTVRLFTTPENLTLSTRALGWDTHTVGCGAMTPVHTFTHSGFTGTRVCVDPVNHVYSVVLSNARFPEKGIDLMVPYAKALNTLIVQCVQGDAPSLPTAPPTPAPQSLDDEGFTPLELIALTAVGTVMVLSLGVCAYSRIHARATAQRLGYSGAPTADDAAMGTMTGFTAVTDGA